MAERTGDLREQISAALDGEAAMPTELDAEDEAFLAAITRLRSKLRVEQAVEPPDVTAPVLARVRPAEVPRAPVRRSLPLVAAAVFVVAALTTAVAVRPGGLLGPTPAVADVGVEVVRAQGEMAALDATVTLVERGAHPDIPERTYAGSLRYRAPEQLWFHLEDRTPLPDGFPANDVDLVVDDGVGWSSGLRNCPVGVQPSCLGRPVTRVVSGLAPFAADWVAPLDLVVPVHGFLPGGEVTAAEVGDAVVVEATVARLRRTIDGLTGAGALRAVHPTDIVRLELDAETFSIRRLTVSAGASRARTSWAAGNGYADEPGARILDLTVTERSLPDSPFPAPPVAGGADAGFVDRGDVGGPEPSWLPPGFSSHRDGAHPAGTVTRSWTDGRAWIRLDVTAEGGRDQLLGDLGPLVRRISVGDGVGYTDPNGSTVSIHTGDLDLSVTGSVPLDVLVEVAASLPVEGTPVPSGWPQGDGVDTVPTGALRPEGPLVARYDGVDLLVAVPGPGQTSAVLRQRLGATLGPPGKADVVEVEVRGVPGRYEPRTQTIRWVEDGWQRELRSPGLDLDGLVAAAEGLG